MQYPQPTNEVPYPQAPKDGPSQPHFNSGATHPNAPQPHAHPSYPHPHPSAHFEHPHYPSSTPFSRFWGWTGSYAAPPPPAGPPAGPALGPYPHSHPPASVHHHAYFRRSCRPRSRLFFPILIAVGGVVAYKRLQRDIDDVRSQAVDGEGRPIRSSRERRWEEWRDRVGGWREREEEARRMRKAREGEEKWEERWRAAMGQQQAKQSPAVTVEQTGEQGKWV
ncbi:hypothetical protein NBRC10513v2_003524 [Rhodotorula toruloides]|uniref:Uncharacterized protein n=1 Tax=Rhodotorula toruloides TaxID=5286 RepID=A0A0K3C8K0_RHOTO